jgi:hypothetical protein
MAALQFFFIVLPLTEEMRFHGAFLEMTEAKLRFAPVSPDSASASAAAWRWYAAFA